MTSGGGAPPITHHPSPGVVGPALLLQPTGASAVGVPTATSFQPGSWIRTKTRPVRTSNPSSSYYPQTTQQQTERPFFYKKTNRTERSGRQTAPVFHRRHTLSSFQPRHAMALYCCAAVLHWQDTRAPRAAWPPMTTKYRLALAISRRVVVLGYLHSSYSKSLF